MQEFQLGESSEGRHLMTRAIRHAADTGDVDYIPALRLFIAEEHRHARDLGRVLDLAGIPRVGRTWPDTVFRWLRKGAGLELSIAVLVTAEIIAKVYYAALREATHAPVLRRLCDQILADEVQHVRFQAERVAILRRGKSAPRLDAADRRPPPVPGRHLPGRLAQARPGHACRRLRLPPLLASNLAGNARRRCCAWTPPATAGTEPPPAAAPPSSPCPAPPLPYPPGTWHKAPTSRVSRRLTAPMRYRESARQPRPTCSVSILASPL